MLIDLRPRARPPFVGLDHVGRCQRVSTRGYPCGSLDDRGGIGFWAAYPEPGRGRLVVVVGFRGPDGRAGGLRLSTRSSGLALAAEVRARASAPRPSGQVRGGYLVDAVLAALTLRRAARDADNLVRSSERDGGVGTGYVTYQLYSHHDVTLLAARIGACPNDVDVFCAMVRGSVRRGYEFPVVVRATDVRRLLAVRSRLGRTCAEVAEPFLAAVAGPALSYVEREMEEGRSHVTLRWLDDAGWDALDDPADGTGLRSALAATPWHADMLLGGFAASGTGRSSDLAAIAASGSVTLPVPRRVAASYLATSTGRCLDGLHGKPFSGPDWAGGDVPWRSPVKNSHGDRLPLQPATGVLSFLSALPASWCPSDPGQWEAFSRLAPVMIEACGWLWDGRSLNDFLLVGGDWPRYEARLAAAVPDGQTVAFAVGLVRDVGRAYAEQVVVPAMRLSREPLDWFARLDHDERFARSGRLAARCLWDDRSLVRILELSRRWHRDREAMAVSVDAFDPDLARRTTWDKVLPDLAVDGVDVVCLGSARALREEGTSGVNPDGSRGMSHCVGSYVGRCLSGQGRILSLRRPGSSPVERLSTAHVTSGMGRLRVVEHRACGNASPSDECVSTLSRYLERASRMGVPRFPAHRVPRRDPAVVAAGYDFRAPGRFEAVRDLWAPFLPGTRRGWSAQRYRSEMRAGSAGSHLDAPGGPTRSVQGLPSLLDALRDCFGRG